MRTALVLLPLLVACSPADVKDSVRIFPTTEALDDGFGSVLVGTISVDPGPRGAIADWQIQTVVSFAYESGDPPVGDVTYVLGFQDVASERLVDGSATVRWDDPPIASCDQNGASERADGGCELALLVLVGLDRAVGYSATLAVRGWLGDAGGSPDGEVVVTFEEATGTVRP